MGRSLSWNKTVVLFLLSIANPAWAGLTYHGRILNSSGQPPSGLVSFTVEIHGKVNATDTDCVIYREFFTNKNLSNTEGIFELSLGTGEGVIDDSTRVAPASTSYSIKDIFLSSRSFPYLSQCPSGSFVDTGSGAEKRFLILKFREGSGSEQVLSPQVINQVPSALTLEGYSKSDFVMKYPDATPGLKVPSGTGAGDRPASPTVGTLRFRSDVGKLEVYVGGATWNQLEAAGASPVTGIISGNGISVSSSTGNVTVSVDTGAGAGKIPQLDASGKLAASMMPATGVVTSVGVTAPVTNTGTATAPILGVTTGTGAGTLAAGNDSRFAPAPTLSDAGKVAKVNSGGTGYDLLTLGTAAVLNTGITNGTIPTIGAGDKLPTSIIPALGYATSISVTAPATNSGTSTAPNISVAMGNTLGTVTAGNDDRLAPSPLIANAGKVVKVNAGGTGYDLLTLGTAATVNTGTSAGNIPVLDAGAKIPASLLPNIAGSNFGTQVQKTFFAGPTSGADAAPSFRTIAETDLPNITTSGKVDGGAITGTIGGSTIINTSGNITGGAGSLSSLALRGSSSGTVTLNPAATVTSYSLTLPSATGSTNQVLGLTGVGQLGWINASSVAVTSVTANAPLSVGGTTTAPVLSISLGNTLGTAAAGNDDRFAPSPLLANAGKVVKVNTGGTGYDLLTLGTSATVDIGNTTANRVIASDANKAVVTGGQIAAALGAVVAGAGRTVIDFNKGNVINLTGNKACAGSTSSGSEDFDLQNMSEGGSYTLIVTAGGAHTGPCTFVHTTGTTVAVGGFKFVPSNAQPSGDTIYTMLKVNGTVYVSWISGF